MSSGAGVVATRLVAARRPRSRARRGALPALTERQFLVGLTLLAGALRCVRLNFQSFWLDEAHTVFYAQHQTLGLFLSRLLKPGENGPLYYLVLGPWLEIFGGSEVSVRGFSVLVSLPAIPLCFAVLRRLAGQRVATLGTVLFALAPYETWYAQEAKMYAALVMVSLLATYCFLRAQERNAALTPSTLEDPRGRAQRRELGVDRSWVAYAAAAAAAIYVHFFAFFAVAAHAVVALWWQPVRQALRPGGQPRSRIRSLAPLLAIMVVLAPVTLLELQAVRRDVAGSAIFGGFTLAQKVGTLLYAFTLNVAPAPLPLVLLVAILLLLTGTAAGTVLPGLRAGQTLLRPDAGDDGEGSQHAVTTVPLGILFWAPVVAYLAVTAVLRSALFADRYFIAVTPYFYGLIAAGMLWFYDRARWQFGAALAAVALAWTYGTAYAWTVPVKEDYRSATAVLNRERRDGDAIVPLPAPMAFAVGYYANAKIDFLYADFPTGDAMPDPGTFLPGHQRVWLIGTLPDEHPRMQDLRRWLEAHGTLETQQDFAGKVRLSRYALYG